MVKKIVKPAQDHPWHSQSKKTRKQPEWRDYSEKGADDWARYTLKSLEATMMVQGKDPEDIY